jgi:signal transduction histidine kinase
VLIGVTAAGAFEHRPSPFSPVQPSIEMQANALNDVLLNQPLMMPPDWVQEALLLLCCMIAGTLVAARRALAGTVFLGVFSLALWLIALVVFTRWDFYLPVGAPIISAWLTYAVMTAFNYRRAWEENWRADAAVATLARGGALLASGRDRESLRRVILETASEALHAQEVLWLVPCEVPTLRCHISQAITHEGSAVLWPAVEGTTTTVTDPQPGSLLQRVRLVPRSRGKTVQAAPETAVSAAGENASTDISPEVLSRWFEQLCNEVDAERQAETSATSLGRTLVAAPLMRPDNLSSQHPAASRGVLVAIGRKDGQLFTPRDAILLETLSEQAALALENLEYYEQLNGRIELANRDMAEAYDLLRDQSIKMTAAVESIDDALIVTNERGHAVYVNAAARDILRDATPSMGDNVPEVLHRYGLHELAAPFDVLPSVARRTLIIDPQLERAAGAKVRREVVQQIPRDGMGMKPDAVEDGETTTVVWSMQFVPLLAENGRMLGAMLVVADVTAQRELDKMKTDFVGYVAHELRTPLTTILGYASLLQGASDRIPAEQRGTMMGSIIQHCKRLNRMITELLDVSRLDAGGTLFLRREPLDLAAMAERVLEEHRAASSRHDLDFEFRSATRPLLAQLDADRMEQVLNNLISNAAKYSPDGGTVTVETVDDGDEVLLRVSDTGMGMTTEQQMNLFQKFYRTSDAQLRGIKGTGLGLYLVKQLVEAHGGHISVESVAGQGTTFTVSLPKQAPADQESQSSAQAMLTIR